MAVWNPWHGCHKTSEGCLNCYMFARDASVGKISTVVQKTADFTLAVRKKRDGSYTVPAEIMEKIRRDFAAGCCSEEECSETIGRVWREDHYLADPHTAVALKVTDEWKASGRAAKAVVTLSTASPFKFPAAVLGAIGSPVSGNEFADMEALSALSGRPVPPALSGLREKPVRFADVVAPDAIGDYVHEIIRKGGV